MFSFMNMVDDYDSRAIDRYEKGDLIVDTCRVTDSDQPYETAVKHPEYNNGNWVIVEMYDTPEDAQVGHDSWVITMTNEKLPDYLQDKSSSISLLLDTISGDREWRKFPREGADETA